MMQIKFKNEIKVLKFHTEHSWVPNTTREAKIIYHIHLIGTCVHVYKNKNILGKLTKGGKFFFFLHFIPTLSHTRTKMHIYS